MTENKLIEAVARAIYGVAPEMTEGDNDTDFGNVVPFDDASGRATSIAILKAQAALRAVRENLPKLDVTQVVIEEAWEDAFNGDHYTRYTGKKHLTLLDLEAEQSDAILAHLGLPTPPADKEE